MNKEDAIEVSRDIIEKNQLFNLDQIVSYLMACRNKGENVYIDFSNHALGVVDRFYSCDINYDKAYMLCYGIPYDVYKHLMAIQFQVTNDSKYGAVDSISGFFGNLQEVYAADAEELRKNNNSSSHKL